MNEKAATAKKRLLSLDANLISPFDNTLQTIAFGYLACAIVYRIPSRAVRFAIPAALLFAVLKTRSDAKQKGMCL